MRSLLLSLGFVLFAASASAQSFCVQGTLGPAGCFGTMSACRAQAAAVDGACYIQQQPSYTTPAPYEPTPNTGGRAYPDISGSFQRGYERARRQQDEQQLRDLEIERQRLENERIRQSIEANSRAQEPMSVWAMPIGRPQPGWYPEERVNACEPLRAIANSTKDALSSGLVTWEQNAAALDNYTKCLGPSLHPELLNSAR